MRFGGDIGSPAGPGSPASQHASCSLGKVSLVRLTLLSVKSGSLAYLVSKHWEKTCDTEEVLAPRGRGSLTERERGREIKRLSHLPECVFWGLPLLSSSLVYLPRLWLGCWGQDGARAPFSAPSFSSPFSLHPPLFSTASPRPAGWAHSAQTDLV